MISFVATPIGNLKDITLRALEALRAADVIFCEDTRHTLKLLNAYEIKKPLLSCHRFNESEAAEKIIACSREGKEVCIVSDAGMPVISDPGNAVCRKLREAGEAYTVLPGACAFVCALVLSAIPNVEIVTLLCAVYGFVLGAQGVLATCIFVACETLIYGLGPWVISYAIHWPAVALVFWLLSRFIKPSRVIPTIVAVIMTTSFGVLTALVDVGLFSGFWDDFGQRFAIYYARGAVFYVTQIVCNALVFPLLFKPAATFLFSLLGDTRK